MKESNFIFRNPNFLLLWLGQICSQSGGRIGEDGEVIPAIGGGGGPGIRDGDEEPAIYEQWWFWAGVVGAVALGVLLTVAIAASGGGQELGEDQGGQIILEF